MVDWWDSARDFLLVLLMLSYAGSLALLLVIWPRDRLEWATTLKIASITAVLVDTCLIVFFGVGGGDLTRTAVFAVATFFSWVFTVVAWVEWRRKRREGA